MRSYVFFGIGTAWLISAIYFYRGGFDIAWGVRGEWHDSIFVLFRWLIPLLLFGWIAPLLFGSWLLLKNKIRN
jgi:hypothetical protein